MVYGLCFILFDMPLARLSISINNNKKRENKMKMKMIQNKKGKERKELVTHSIDSIFVALSFSLW
jgi:hypothetical protein